MGHEASSMLADGVIPTVEGERREGVQQRTASAHRRPRYRRARAEGLLAHRNPEARAGGRFEKLYRFAPLMRFGGGTNEVLRDVIAQRGHGMPSYGR